MHRLITAIQPYAWGSKTAIAELCGRAPPGNPEAEMWMGAHAVAPSKIEATGQMLAEYINQDPSARLGKSALDAFGARLPFLFKVLAAAEPLSLQAHPTTAEAEAGFARENAAGIPLSAANRNYKDQFHKPELICALTTFWALSGFRDVEKTKALVKEIACDALSKICVPLWNLQPSDALRTVFLALVSMEKSEAESFVALVSDRCKIHESAGGAFHAECAWLLRIVTLYPGDVGAVVSLLLNLVRLDPGQAIYLPAGNLHAYLEGTGLELMASSDNVLRGGLTKKHIDVPELSRVLDFHAGPTPLLIAEPRSAFESVYRTNAAEFELSRVLVTPSSAPVLTPRGPEILLVTEGAIRARGLTEVALRSGECAFVPADEGSVTLLGGGVVHRAQIGDTANARLG